MKIAVIGTGYVGLVTGAGFSDFGHDVTCVDIDPKRIETLNRGEIPFFEPGLPELVARNSKLGRLRFTTSTAEAVANAKIVFIAVGTPSGEDGSADLSYVLEAARQIGGALTGFTVVITKSTVPVGTADKVKAAVASATKQPFAVASNPEFLKEGDAVNDFLKPARVIVGADDPKAVDLLRTLYHGVLRTSDRVQIMDIRSAELTKYAANAMLATRISFMNELAHLCEAVGADIETIRKGIGADPRIGAKFLFAGAGFGGSCLLGHETILVRDPAPRMTTLRSLIDTDNQSPIAICQHPKDVEVLSWTRDGVRFLPVSSITRRPYEGSICDIKTKMGRRVSCTADHPFVVRANGDWKTVIASNLTTDDWIPIATERASNLKDSVERFDVLGSLLSLGMPPKQIIVRIGDERACLPEVTDALRTVVRDSNRLSDIRRNGTLRLDEALAANLDLVDATIGTSRSGTYIPTTLANTEAFWRVIGLYCAEGWITTDLGRDGASRMRISWSFHPRNEEHLVDEVREFWQSVGIKASVYTAPTTRKVSVSSRLLATWLVRVLGIGTNCYTQRVPDRLWSAPYSHRRGFLAGLWNGDGSWSYVSNRRGIVWEYGTASREIADGVLRLLGDLGIVASWKIGRPPGSTVDTHFVRISGASQVEQLLDFTNPAEHQQIKRSIAAQQKRTLPTGYRTDGATIVRVVSNTQRHYQGYVYSLEVPGSETFVTSGGLVVHNCFPKDLRALIHTGREHEVQLGIVSAVERANERQKRLLGERVISHFDGKLAGKRIAIWGLAFKPETDDIRESPALTLIEQLSDAGATISGYDPAAMPNIQERLGGAIVLADDPYSAATGADALVLVTEWHELRHPDLVKLKSLMRTPTLFDGRNVWPGAEAREAGFHYQGIGRRD